MLWASVGREHVHENKLIFFVDNSMATHNSSITSYAFKALAAYDYHQNETKYGLYYNLLH